MFIELKMNISHYRRVAASLIIWATMIAPTMASEQPVQVIAFEYPPYISQQSESNNYILSTLYRVFAESTSIDIQANFLSAARAHKTVESERWCLSLYPPIIPTTSHILIPLQEEFIELKLFRLTQPDAFMGKQLKGKTIAQLRMQTPEGVIKEFTAEGATFFQMETIPQGVQLLFKQRVDYLYGDAKAIEFAADNLGYDISQLQASALTYRRFPVGVWVNQQCPQSEQVLSQLKQAGFKMIQGNHSRFQSH
ncbi:hypothetical protein [Shewanella gaetbuli]|uniref:Bacterial extracellular solute-binding proteins, family 3 n=1 Tax=Shewanella gaetbuli TaxID=220752 RepID=A0A9X1ZV39_9GAMM|nr:hypothetical protein [Shewanella gaetbuli]MCL1142866.1 hypothetical protein [Shewanella gaetbuli]